MTKEVWKFYKEINHPKWGHRIYEVSSYGRVKCNGELFTCIIHKSQGYYYLCKKPLHRIVAELFLPDWDPNKEVDHIDGNKLNNRIDNLRMCSHKENMNNPITKKCISDAKIGSIPWNYNKPNAYTEESKQKMSKSQKLTLYKHKRDEKGRFC